MMRGMSKEEHSYNELLEALLNLSSIELSEENTWYEKTFGKNLPAEEKTTPKMGAALGIPRARGCQTSAKDDRGKA